MSDSYDVAIVGAGPAGAYTAKCLADAGLSVYCVEKRQEIGAPKRCAEGLALAYFDKLGIKPDNKFCMQEIRGFIFTSPSGHKLKFKKKLEDYGGYVLERKIFDKHVATLAARAGARIEAKTRCTGLLKENRKIVGIKVESFGEEREIRAKLVIGADGVDSKVARWAGLQSVQKFNEYESGAQFEMANIELEDPECLEFYSGKEIAPNGYLWVFPKGRDIANDGLGMEPSDRRPIEYLRDWVNKQDRFKNGSILEVNAGGIPVGGPLKTFVADNFMVVGDAAHQVNPIHGGGIGLAMLSGKMLADVAVEAFKEKDLSAKRLSEYDRKWQKEFGKWISNLLKLKKFSHNLKDTQLDGITEAITGDDLLKLSDGKLREVGMVMLKKAPKLGKIFLSGLI